MVLQRENIANKYTKCLDFYFLIARMSYQLTELVSGNVLVNKVSAVTAYQI